MTPSTSQAPIRVAIGICMSLLLAAAHAGTVSQVQGTVNDGQTITVTGSGFGATGPQVLLFDDFENGTAGSWLNTSGAKIGRWTYIKNFPSYASDYARSGTGSVAVSNYFPNDFGRNCPNAAGGCDNDRYSAFGIDFGDYLGGGEASEAYWEYSYFVVPGNLFPLETSYRVNFKTSWIFGYRGDHGQTSNDWRLFAGNFAPNSNGILDAQVATNNCSGSGCIDLYLDSSCGHNMYPNEEVLLSPKGRWIRHMEYARGSTSCNGELTMMEAPFINTSVPGYTCRANSLNICAGGSRAGQTCTGNDQCPGSSCNYENAGGDRNTCEIVRKERTGHKTLQSIGASGWGRLVLNAYATNSDGNSVGAGRYQWRYDDVYVAVGPGARARVALANFATWGDQANGNRFDAMVCTPTSWSDASVSCTVRKGAFVSGQQLYLFVIDASGKVSDQDSGVSGAQGFPVVFGGGVTMTQPSPPTNVTAQ